MNEITVEKKSTEELKELGVFDWPTWGCDVSEFDWTYSDREQCYILEGRVSVEPSDERGSAEFGPGDFVTFPKGMDCVWRVIEPVKKHYRFG